MQFIYNDVSSLEGEELGDPESRVMEWAGREKLRLKKVRFLRKNFGWVSHLFRKGVERMIAISILRSLLEQGLQTSAELSGADLERIVALAHEDFDGFQDCSPEAWDEIKNGAVALPFVFDGGVIPWLESLKEEAVEVCGGFRERCLDEICMMMEAGGVSYRSNEPLIYSLPQELNERVEGDGLPLMEIPSKIPLHDSPLLKVVLSK